MDQNISIRKVEKLIKKLPYTTLILNNSKRVKVFSGKDAFDLLSKTFAAEQVKPIMEELIKSNFIIKAIVKEKTCNISLQKSFKEEDSYIIVRESGQYFNLLVGLLIIGGCLAVAMFQMWPKSVKGYSVYVGYAMMAFLVFMLVLGVIRLIVFSITFFTHPPGIWLFPNLFADVGFVDSFIPVWSYHGVNTLPKKE
ncbi:Translocation protein S62 [Gurleya vavrai]